MTAEDQDAEVGRLVRERRDLRAHHQALVSRAQSVGKLLSCMGKALYVRPAGRPYPEHMLRIEEDGSVRVSDEYQAQQIVTGKFPEAEDIRQLLEQVKQAERRLAELEGQLKAFSA